jgi:hypothetical protein
MMLRHVARPLLAAPIFYDGIRTAIWPTHELAQWRRKLPTSVELSEEQLVNVIRAHGALNAGLALSLAFGVCPRVSALALAALAIEEAVLHHPLPDDGHRAERVVHHMGRIGAARIAGADYEGRPGAKWRIESARRAHAKAKRHSGNKWHSGKDDD